MASVRYEYLGESLTIREWAERYEINIHTLRSRLKRGMRIDEALSFGSRHIAPQIEIDGVQRSKAEWIREYKADPVEVRRRMDNGLSFEDALVKKPKKVLAKTILDESVELKGRRYEAGTQMSIAAWAKAAGIGRTTLQMRLKHVPLHKALEAGSERYRMNKIGRPAKLYGHGGYRRTVKEWAKFYGVDRSKLFRSFGTYTSAIVLEWLAQGNDLDQLSKYMKAHGNKAEFMYGEGADRVAYAAGLKRLSEKLKEGPFRVLEKGKK